MDKSRPVDRRLALQCTVGITLVLAGIHLPGKLHAQPTYKVSAEQLQLALSRRFPRGYSVGSLFDLTLQPPRLRFMPAQNRMGAELTVEAAGPALRRSSAGLFDLDFALRYEASDLSIRAAQLQVNALRFDDLPPGPAALLSAYGPALAEQALQDVVLHQLKSQDLALPDSMGLQPGSITVTSNGLFIGFVPKPPS